MNSLRTLCAVALFSGTILVSASVNAQTNSHLVITEISSTSLTATLNGLPQTIINTANDLWFILTPGVQVEGQFYWNEPNEPGKLNIVQGQPDVDRISIGSDLSLPGSFLADGATDSTHFTMNGSPLDVTFNDLAGRSEQVGVPDAASTLPLLSLALGALVVLPKRRAT